MCMHGPTYKITDYRVRRFELNLVGAGRNWGHVVLSAGGGPQKNITLSHRHGCLVSALTGRNKKKAGFLRARHL